MTRRMARLAVCGILAVFSFLATGGAAHADRADQLFKKGKKLLAEKRYPEACTAFEDSDRIDPGIGAKLNVARCYQEWGKLATAWRWFTDAERMANQTKDDRATKIHELVEELDPTVPRLKVTAPRDADTRGLAIKLDGVDFDVAALGTDRRVDPGPHQVDYIVDGAKQTKVIPVERGASSEIILDLPTRATPHRTTRAARPEVSERDPGRNRRLLGLGIGGAGVVAVGIAGIVTLGARSDYKDALRAHCRGATDMCDADGLAATHSARHRANIATGVTIFGLAAVAGGLVLYFTTPAAAARHDEHALYLAPSIGGDGGGVVLGGAF